VKWVLDSAAINYVATQSRNYNAAFNRLTELVNGGELTFCDQVVAELERTAEGEPGPLWAATVKDQRADPGATYSAQRWVLSNVEDIVDDDDPVDAAPYVVAHAKSLQDEGESEITVVTEDTADKPTRKAIRTVCAQLAIPCLSVADMMQACGHQWP